MTIATYKVAGMTCGHCVQAVRNELVKVDGVSNVEVDLESATVTVESAGDLAHEVVVNAVDEAGYELVS